MEDSVAACEKIRRDAYEVMMKGGYLERVRKVGSELERWHRYLDDFARPGWAGAQEDPLAQPRIFPMMAGLGKSAWQDPKQLEAAAILEQSVAVLREEIEGVRAEDFIQYDGTILTSGRWSVMPVFMFGEESGSLLFKRNVFPQTTKLIRSLPGVCQDLPLGDFVFSAHAPRTRLVPHCSWDPFRLRLHLGLRVPQGCGIRVGRESRQWRNGEVIAFHDSFEHETWNESDEERVVLIVDVWHPELTLAERRAILACTRKKEIRTMLMRTRAPLNTQAPWFRRFTEVERTDPLIAEFWNG
jgi:aspartyl/asparaginyl beta-hydroxylase